MSLTEASGFSCPYCMTYNDLDIDIDNDVGQQQIVDCQICCQPIELSVFYSGDFGFEIVAKRDSD